MTLKISRNRKIIKIRAEISNIKKEKQKSKQTLEYTNLCLLTPNSVLRNHF